MSWWDDYMAWQGRNRAFVEQYIPPRPNGSPTVMFGSGGLNMLTGSGAATAAASRFAGFNPPKVLQRPFEADYPMQGGLNGTALASDIDGNPLTAPFIAGRRMVGGGDTPLSPADIDAVATATNGIGAQAVAPRTLPRNTVGMFERTAGPDGPIRRTYVSNALGPDSAATVAAHEMGHSIDDIAGKVLTNGLTDELGPLYNKLNNQQNYGPAFRPQDAKYTGDAIPREYMAEAIRSYMQDPNYLKSVAPNTAFAIRQAVNSHPVLSKAIQFNSLGALTFGGAALGQQASDPDMGTQ